jgi:hypothetical protein
VQAWDLELDKENLARLAVQYKNDRAGLDALLRGRHYNTDLSWSWEQIQALKEECENCDNLRTSLKSFYKAWSLPKTDENIEEICREFRGREDELSKGLQRKYHGTDHNWSEESLRAKVLEISRIPQISTAKSDVSGRLQSLIINFIKKWDGRCEEVGKLDAYALEVQYGADIDSLNKRLRDVAYGTDLTSSNAEIEACAKCASAGSTDLSSISPCYLPMDLSSNIHAKGEIEAYSQQESSRSGPTLNFSPMLGARRTSSSGRVTPLEPRLLPKYDSPKLSVGITCNVYVVSASSLKNFYSFCCVYPKFPGHLPNLPSCNGN